MIWTVAVGTAWVVGIGLMLAAFLLSATGV